MDTHRIHAALYRALQPSPGSIALLLEITRVLLLFTLFLQHVPVYLPIALCMYTGPLRFAAGYLEDAAGSLSKYVLVYVSLTGRGFLAQRTSREGSCDWCGERGKAILCKILCSGTPLSQAPPSS